MSKFNGSVILGLYEQAMEPARARLKTRVFGLLESNKDPQFWHKFLIAYCAQGVHMTKDVPRWIAQSGDKAIQLGSKTFGEILRSHAAHEEGHHELFINDANSLIDLYRQKYNEEINQAAVPWNPPLPSVRQYRQCHEDIIQSSMPLRQVALEYEVEMLSVAIGGDLFQRIVGICGHDIIPCLTFITEHVAADVGHTKFNRILLDRILLKHGEKLDQFYKTGQHILEIYADYLISLADYTAHHMTLRQAI